MFVPRQDTANRRWLPVAIATVLVAVVFIVGMDSKGLIKMLPFGFAERILDRDLPEHLQQVFPGATGVLEKTNESAPSLYRIQQRIRF